MKTLILSQMTVFRSLGLAMLLLITACSGSGGSGTNNSGSDAGNDASNDAGNTDNTGVAVEGWVLDANRRFLEAVEVFDASGVLAKSDSNGRLQFRLPEGSTGPLRLRKTGYANQTVPLQVLNGKAEFEATMGKRGAVISIVPDGPVDVAGAYGARVSLPADALVDADGNLVSGDVELTITPVDVSSDTELGVFPGYFAGEDANGAPAPLIMSYGTVEYRFTQNGEELNLAEGQSAEIEIPVFVRNHPDGSLIQIGDSGALWYLNEETGLWKQEGAGTVVESVASPTGLALRANVGHFSWWNHDIAPETCLLTINISGLPDGVEFILKGQTEVDYPRSASTAASNIGGEYITPRDKPVELSATVATEDGIYRARQTTTCSGVSDATTLVFQGPENPVINYFKGRTQPKFILELDPNNPSDLRWALDGQDAIFEWSVGGADRLTLTSDQGHDTTLGNNSGVVQFPLELNGSYADVYQFTLLAETNEGGIDSKVVELQYGDAKPVIYSADVWQDASNKNVQAATLTWEVKGADSINIWVGIYDDVSPVLLLEDYDPPQTGAAVINTVQELLSFLVDWCGDCSYANLPVTMQFTNQYGTSEVTVYVTVFDPSLFDSAPTGG